MQERFRRHMATSGLIPPGGRVLVGYSGGADSTCLLHLLATMGIDVVAAHLHHGQREEADQEQRLCEAFAQELDIPFVTGRADVPRMAHDLGIGLEEAGREARYAFFRQAAFGTECALIATAHTRTDLVETMLLNIGRGSGLAGLAGIPERREGIVRPLLPFSREETREYCEARGLWFHDDPANGDISFSRARIRHRVLPELRAINPGTEAALLRLAGIAQEEDGFLNGMAAAALEQSEVPLNGDLGFLTRDVEIRFGRSHLGSLPPVLFKRAIRLAVEALGGALDFDQTNLVMQGVAGQERGSVTAEGGEVVTEWDPEHVDVRRLRPTEPFRYPLTVPGETASDEFGWQFTAFEDAYDGAPPRRASLEVQIAQSGVKGTLYFRTVQPGDTIRPLGFDGRRKIADLMSEARLTEAARRRLPIVCDFVGPIWAPGVCLDERARPEGGGRVLRIAFAAMSQPN
jgi:tRNA(Ile)-lysidine synthase